MDATVITAIILLFLGLALLGGLGWVLLSAVMPASRGLLDRNKLRRKEHLLEEAEAMLKERPEEALALLQQSFMLDHIKSTDQMIEASVNHHLAILSRLISIAEQHGTHLENLAVVEDLLHSRGQLLRSFREAASSQQRLRGQRSEEGKSTPLWATLEFERRLNDLRDRIDTNRKSIEGQLDLLIRSLKETRPQAPVTFH